MADWSGLFVPAYEHHGGTVRIPLPSVLLTHPEDGGPPTETAKIVLNILVLRMQ